MKQALLVAIFSTLSFQAFSQTTYFTNPNGMPIGQAQQVGNTTYYSNPNGMPIGQAQSMSFPTQPTAPLTPKSPLSPPSMFNQQ